MRSASKGLLIVFAVTSLGLWGCAQNQNGAAKARVRELEARHAKLEEDYQVLTVANDKVRKRLAVVEAQLSKKGDELQKVVRERDTFRRQASTRTGERDALRAHLVQFSRELQTLAGRVEAATGASAKDLTAALSD
jgi:chromosome segregation ATPase